MSDTLVSLREAFESGRLAKLDYYQAMRERHGALAQYAELIGGTEIASVRIEPGRVLFTTRRGVVLECDPTDRGIPPVVAMNQRTYEPDDTRMLLALVEDGMGVFDVGANLGWYSLHIARRFSRCRVCAFEPIPKTRAFLERNAGHNDLDNLRVFAHGLHREETVLTFHVDPAIMGAASSAPDASTGPLEVDCAVRRVDDVRVDLDLAVDVMKVDVEGAELLVLEGAEQTLRRDRPILMIELLRIHAAKFGYHANAVIDRLAALGYACFTTADGRLDSFDRMTDQTTETNFFFLHRAKHEAKISAHVR